MKNSLQKPNLSRGCLSIRNQRLIWGQQTHIMGIVNITCDSFSGDGTTDDKQAALIAKEEVKAGASIIDLGAESTRPGHIPISEEEELSRLLPALQTIRNQTETMLSIDTYKANVFKKAHDNGADILNSIWGLNDELLGLIVERDCPIVIMHNQREPIYTNNVIDEVLQYLSNSANKAIKAGLKTEQIILDPGIGFGKLPEHNLSILKSLDKLVALGFPTLLGTSRKSTIGKITGKSVTERVYGTAATVALAIASGIDVVRVHDVSAISDVVKVSDAIVRNWRPSNWVNE